MKIIKGNEIENELQGLVLEAIKYIDDNHETIELGSFFHKGTSLNIIKIAYETVVESVDYIYEAHYLVDDIHYIKEGEEYCSIAKREFSRLEKDYDSVNDYELFKSNDFDFSLVRSGDVVIFEKEELHLTGIHSKKSNVIKYVIKLSR